MAFKVDRKADPLPEGNLFSNASLPAHRIVFLVIDSLPYVLEVPDLLEIISV